MEQKTQTLAVEIEKVRRLVPFLLAEANAIVDLIDEMNLHSGTIQDADYLKLVEGWKNARAAIANIPAKYGVLEKGGADLFTQLEAFCDFALPPEGDSLESSLEKVRAVLDQAYQMLAMMGVDLHGKEGLKAFIDATEQVKVAETTIKGLESLDIPVELRKQLSGTINSGVADRLKPVAQALIRLKEPGHLLDRLTTAFELLDKDNFSEEYITNFTRIMNVVRIIYDILSKIELMRDEVERAVQTLDIEKLRSLRAEARRVRRLYQILMAQSPAEEISIRLEEFATATRIPYYN